ncbi:MAG: DNA damage-inducible protein D, partial [Candidatus Gracilibacteria bacterium]|nr:DNA damage-inducible protein D [Candidatus Gracilibacteria bacterium]
MNKEISEVYKRLESIKHFQDGLEYWSARELMPLLGYKEWRKFVGVIKKAKSACKESGLAVEYHFVGADKMIKIATGSQRETLREVRDVLLTRYACYLI